MTGGLTKADWAKNILIQKYPQLAGNSGKRWADLNGDKKIQETELLKDENHNGVLGDNEDFLKYLERNQGILIQQIPLLKTALQLKPDNRIHQLMQLESKLVTPAQTREGYNRLTSVLDRIKAVLEDEEFRSLPILVKIKIAFEVIRLSGYKFGSQEDPLLTGNILSGGLDCDSSAFIILALADELKSSDPSWENVGLVVIPGHAFLAIVEPGKTIYYEYGGEQTQEDYIERFKLSRKDIDRTLTPLFGEKIFSIFYLNRGFAHTIQKQHEEAYYDFSKVIEIYPENADAYTIRGSTSLLLGVKKSSRAYLIKARADLIKAKELNPPSSIILNNLGKTYFLLGDYTEALELYSEAIKLDPEDFEAYKNRGFLYYKLGKPDKALTDLTKAKALLDSERKRKNTTH